MSRAYLLVVAVAAAGCFPDFDGISDRANDSQDHPTGTSDIFPIGLAGLAPTPSAPMRFVASGQRASSLSVFEYSESGSLTTASTVIVNDLPTQAPFSMAASTVEGGPFGGVIAVSNTGATIPIFAAGGNGMPPMHLGTLPTNQCGTAGEIGGPKHLLLAQTAVGPTVAEPADLVVASGNRLAVFPNVGEMPGIATPSCFSCGLLGDVNSITAIEHSGGDEESLLVVVRRGANQIGIVIFDADLIRVRDGMNCFTMMDPLVLTEVILEDAPPDFGEHVAVGEVDNDEAELADVAFSSESNEEVVFFRDFETGAAAVSIEAPGEPSTQTFFGASLVFGDVAGSDGDELLVGARQGLQGSTRSGVVHVYDLRSTPTELNLVSDSEPVDGQGFGRFVTVANWDLGVINDERESQDLAIVAADQEVFTFFAIQDAVDPRR